jgi:hypothetical protein
MKYMQVTNQRRNPGFTLVEMLVIAPIVILAIGGFIALMVTMVGDVLATRDQNTITYDAQNALNRIEQDTRLSVQFMSATNTLMTPQGSDNNFTGNAAFTNATPGNSLILSMLATDKNPTDSTRQLIYYANQPNACGATQSANQIFLTNVIYFVNNGSLWRRTILPQYNTNSTVDINTVCSVPWQQNSCSPGYATGLRCQTNDIEVMKNVSSIAVQYFSDPGSNTDLGPTGAANAMTIGVTINGATATGGRNITSSSNIRATRLNITPKNAGFTALAFSQQPSDAYAIATSTNVTFTATSNYSTSTVAWQRSTDNGTTWTAISGATSYTLTLPTVSVSQNGYLYRAVITDSGNSVTSNPAMLHVTMWGGLGLQNNWTDYGAPYSANGYTLTTSGVVMLKGNLKRTGTPAVNEIIGVLPPGYRPSNRLMFETSSSADSSTGQNTSRIDIDTSGNILFENGDSGYLTLEGINFMPSSTSFTPLTLTNGWSNYGASIYGGTFASAAYAVDGVGRVHTQGVIKGGTIADNTQLVTNLTGASLLTPEYLHVPDRSTGFGYIGVDPVKGLVAKGNGNSNTFMAINSAYLPQSVSGWTPLTLGNGWVQYPGFSTPSYIKTSDNVVMLKGLIKSGTTTNGTIINPTAPLPVGYRPKDRTLIAGGVNNTKTVRYDVRTDGYIEYYYGDNVWSSLDAITFLAEQ